MDDQRCLTSGEPANARWWAAQALWVLIRIRIGIGVVSELTSPATTVSMGMTPIVIASTTATTLTTTLTTTPTSTATPRCTIVATQIRS